MNPLDQVQAQDPIQILAKENMLQIFSYLSQDDIDSSSKVNHFWRDSIQSDFSLFTCIELKNAEKSYYGKPDPWDAEKENIEEMRLTIGQLSRFSNLSNNRLNQVIIGLAAFEGCLPRFTQDWRFSRLGIVFDTLALSSHTLTRLQLDFPKIERTNGSVRASAEYIQVMLSRLTSFPQLKEVELKALPLFDMISKSKTKKLTLSSHSYQPQWYVHGDEEWELLGPDVEAVSHLLPLNGIVREMNAFTEGQLSHLISTPDERKQNVAPYLECSTLEEIQGSVETLEELEVQLGISLFPFELFNLIFGCSQLTSFTLRCNFEDREDDADLWETTLPLEAVQQSNLKTLAILIKGRGIIQIDGSMLKWVGSQLDTLCFKNQTSNETLVGEARQLFHLVQNVALTIK